MAKIYVPIISENSELYKVETVENDNSFTINGIAKGSPKYNKVEELVNKLRPFSENKFFSIKIRSSESNSKFDSFDHSTNSINLGIFLSLHSKVNKLRFDEKYETITVTGNYELDKGNKIHLLPVTEILSKFEIAKKNAIQYSDKKHLFLYVSSEENLPVSEGWHDNLFVIALTHDESIECVFAEVFDFEEEQKQVLKVLKDKYQNEYIETSSFINWKKEIIKSECGGFLLTGNSNSGKSIAAANLCKYLLNTKVIEDIVWLSIIDNRYFWSEITKNNGNSISLDKTEIIKGLFAEEFNKLDKLLNNNKKICFVIDNIEGEFVDRILDFLKNNYQNFIENNLLKVLITSWHSPRDVETINILKMSEKDTEVLEIERNVFDLIVYSVLNSSRNSSVFYEETDKLKTYFLNLLYIQCCDGKKSWPGYVNLAVATLDKLSIQDFINRYESEDLKKLSPKVRSIRIAFEVRDLLSQLVLFTYVGLNNYWHEIEYDKIGLILNEKIFNCKTVGNLLINERNIEDSFKNLIQAELINKEYNRTKNKYEYKIKEDVIRFCVLSTAENKEISEEFLMVRDTLISETVKIDHTIQNNYFDDFRRLIQDFKGTVNHFVVKCIECERNLAYLSLLDTKGIDPDYLDEDGQSPIDVMWCKEASVDNLERLKYLLKKGFPYRKKIPCHDRAGNNYIYSPLILVADKCSVQWVEIILENQLFDDLNEYEFQGKFTPLQLYAIGSSVEAVDLLIKAGADYSINTKNGWSILSLAVLNDTHPEILEYLLKNSFHGDINYKDDKGKTALDYAKQTNNQKAIELLEKYEKIYKFPQK